MHRFSQKDQIPDLAARICHDEHLESLFLEYLRLSSSMELLKSFSIFPKYKKSLALVCQLALDAFLVESNGKFPIQQLNGQLSALIQEITILLQKRYRLEEYFNS